jgi:hypothetical protein
VEMQGGRRHFEALAEIMRDPTEHRRVLNQWATRSPALPAQVGTRSSELRELRLPTITFSDSWQIDVPATCVNLHCKPRWEQCR